MSESESTNDWFPEQAEEQLDILDVDGNECWLEAFDEDGGYVHADPRDDPYYFGADRLNRDFEPA